MNKKETIKVLVIRFSSIGDIVLCSPVLRCLKKVENRAIETHLVTKKGYAGFVGSYPYVDKLHLFDGDLKGLIRQLKTEKFDYVLDLHGNLRSMRIKMALGKASSTFNKLNIEKWLLTSLKTDWLPRVHIVDRLIDAAAPLGAINDGLGLDFFIPEKDYVDPNQVSDNLSKGYVGFVIGGTYFSKRLPVEKIISICSKIDLPVVLLGGPEDKEAGSMIEAALPEKVINTCGLFNLNQSASLVKQAEVIVTHDTGLMHIAAALHKPVASVWGNTVPEFGMYPYYPADFSPELTSVYEVKGLKCRPCSKIGYNHCPAKHFNCMNQINEVALADWVNQTVLKIRLG